jgi:hypothetical protein
VLLAILQDYSDSLGVSTTEIVGVSLLSRLSSPQPSKELEAADLEVLSAVVIDIRLANPNKAIELGGRRIAGKVSREVRAIQVGSRSPINFDPGALII